MLTVALWPGTTPGQAASPSLEETIAFIEDKLEKWSDDSRYHPSDGRDDYFYSDVIAADVDEELVMFLRILTGSNRRLDGDFWIHFKVSDVEFRGYKRDSWLDEQGDVQRLIWTVCRDGSACISQYEWGSGVRRSLPSLEIAIHRVDLRDRMLEPWPI